MRSHVYSCIWSLLNAYTWAEMKVLSYLDSMCALWVKLVGETVVQKEEIVYVVDEDMKILYEPPNSTNTRVTRILFRGPTRDEDFDCVFPTRGKRIPGWRTHFVYLSNMVEEYTTFANTLAWIQNGVENTHASPPPIQWKHLLMALHIFYRTAEPFPEQMEWMDENVESHIWTPRMKSVRIPLTLRK